MSTETPSNEPRAITGYFAWGLILTILALCWIWGAKLTAKEQQARQALLIDITPALVQGVSVDPTASASDLITQIDALRQQGDHHSAELAAKYVQLCLTRQLNKTQARYCQHIQ